MERKVLETCQYWALVQEDGNFVFSSHTITGDHFLTFRVPKGISVKRQEDTLYIEYSWSEPSYKTITDFVEGDNHVMARCCKRVLLIKKDDYKIFYVKELMSYEFGPNLYKLLEFNRSSLAGCEYLATRWGNNNRNFRKICKSKSESHYQIYIDSQNIRVIYQEGEDVKVYASGLQINGTKVYTFNNIDSFYRVKRKIGNYTYFYSFFILRRVDGYKTFLLNLKTLKIEKIGDDIYYNEDFIPIVRGIDKAAFYDRDKNIYKTFEEYLYINHHIYDINLKSLTLSIDKGEEPTTYVTLLDAIDYHIALVDDKGLRIFKIIGGFEADINLQELHYYIRCPHAKSELCIVLENEYYHTDIEYFDPASNQFVIDEAAIRYKHYRDVENKGSIAEHYDLIEDGLDGEPDAIWNID